MTADADVLQDELSTHSRRCNLVQDRRHQIGSCRDPTPRKPGTRRIVHVTTKTVSYHFNSPERPRLQPRPSASANRPLDQATSLGLVTADARSFECADPGPLGSQLSTPGRSPKSDRLSRRRSGRVDGRPREPEIKHNRPKDAPLLPFNYLDSSGTTTRLCTLTFPPLSTFVAYSGS